MTQANRGDRSGLRGSLRDYDPDGFYCELTSLPASPTDPIRLIRDRLDTMRIPSLRRRAKASDRELYNLGITFTVYSERNAIDRVLPFDIIPRVLSAPDWSILESGTTQRVMAINRFLHDIYHDAKILKDRIIPADLVYGNANYRREMVGLDLPHDTYVQVCGIDVIRDPAGKLYVLEDNARTPSGVSYVIENRHLMLRAFPDLVANIGLRPVSDYPLKLRAALAEVGPRGMPDPQVVLLSPGVFNSAYFEHVFLAREMGVPLVEGRDLVIEDDLVFMKTTGGLRRVDVIYRRVDDAFLDPHMFNPESLLGVPGIMQVYLKGRVSIANAVGTGVADDKAVYAYMPRIIKYYLGEEPILPNVTTYSCREKDGLAYTLDHLAELVVKPVGESGGYGITVGPRASSAQLEDCRAKILANPENYISQPMISLSVCPTLIDGRIEARHVDLRPFLVTGRDTWVLPGGLTRVALPKGSLIVNSSQGGGTKDTWVLG